MQSSYSIYDPLNLRDSIEAITLFLRRTDTSDKAPRNILNFFQSLFENVEFAEKNLENTIQTIQKVFSGNLPESKMEYIAQKVLSGSIDDRLRSNLTPIVNKIRKYSEQEDLLEKLRSQISRRFFAEDEQKAAEAALAAGDDVGFVLCIIKHGFRYLFNLPCFFADRMYDEALTYDFDSSLRYELMRAAAEKGNRNAALEYGNYLAKHGPYPQAFTYLLMALPLPAAVWNIAFLIEKQSVGPEQVRQFREVFRLEEKLSAKDYEIYRQELDAVFCTETSMEAYNSTVCAYRAYFWLAYRGFFKGFHSMAKMLGSKKMVVSEASPLFHTQDLIDKYYTNAIRGSCVVGIRNKSGYLLKQLLEEDNKEQTPEDTEYMLELMQVSAGMNLARSYYDYGRYLEYVSNKEGTVINKEEIQACYLKALSLDLGGPDVRGDAYLRLGKLSDNRREKRTYFQNAFHQGISDAAQLLEQLEQEEKKIK